MRETLEMHTAARMQNMAQIRNKNIYSVTKLLFVLFSKSSLGALGVESPHGGVIFTQKIIGISLFLFYSAIEPQSALH